MRKASKSKPGVSFTVLGDPQLKPCELGTLALGRLLDFLPRNGHDPGPDPPSLGSVPRKNVSIYGPTRAMEFSPGFQPHKRSLDQSSARRMYFRPGGTVRS